MGHAPICEIASCDCRLVRKHILIHTRSVPFTNMMTGEKRSNTSQVPFGETNQQASAQRGESWPSAVSAFVVKMKAPVFGSRSKGGTKWQDPKTQDGFVFVFREPPYNKSKWLSALPLKQPHKDTSENSMLVPPDMLRF